MSEENPFRFAAAQGSLNRASEEEQTETAENRWAAHLEACRVILINSAENRLILAQEAMSAWDHPCEVRAVYRIETMTGAVLFRTSLHVSAHHIVQDGESRSLQTPRRSSSYGGIRGWKYRGTSPEIPVA